MQLQYVLTSTKIWKIDVSFIYRLWYSFITISLFIFYFKIIEGTRAHSEWSDSLRGEAIKQ